MKKFNDKREQIWKIRTETTINEHDFEYIYKCGALVALHDLSQKEFYPKYFALYKLQSNCW